MIDYLLFTRTTRRVSLVEYQLLTYPEHMRSPSLLSDVCIAQSSVSCVVFCRPLSFYSFLFHFIVCPSNYCSYYLVGIKTPSPILALWTSSRHEYICNRDQHDLTVLNVYVHL